MTSSAQAALVLERLLIDPTFRAGFRVAPAATLERHGMPEMASRMRRDARVVQTLEIRESRSSLAGVMMAAAVEGVALFHEVARQARPLDDESAEAMRRAFARPAVRQLTSVMPAAGAAAGPGLPDPSATPVVPAAASAAAAPNVPDAASTPAVPGASAEGSAPAAVDVPAASSAPDPAGASVGGVPDAATAAPSNPAGAMPVITSAAPRTGVIVAAPHDPPAHGHRHHDVQADAADAGDAVVPYPGDDASQAALAQWMAAAAKRAGLPPELPLMAALQESGLRNLKSGDADSAGFFQMRVSVWDHGAYNGYRDDPELQLKWFIDQALREKAAQPNLAASPQSYGEWIADVERPLAAYRGLYQPHLSQARDLLHQAAPHAHAADAAADAHDADAGAFPQRLLSVAAHELGVTEHPPGSNDGARIAQYRSAGPDAGVGPWCAYFVSWVAKRAGAPLGENGFASVDALWAWAEQSGHAVQTPKPGDLIVWDEHVGIVERVDADGTLHTIEGNTSDEVARRVHTPAGVVGYVRLT